MSSAADFLSAVFDDFGDVGAKAALIVEQKRLAAQKEIEKKNPEKQIQKSITESLSHHYTPPETPKPPQGSEVQSQEHNGAPEQLGAQNIGSLAHSGAQQQLGAHNFGAPGQFKAPKPLGLQNLGSSALQDAPTQFRAHNLNVPAQFKAPGQYRAPAFLGAQKQLGILAHSDVLDYLDAPRQLRAPSPLGSHNFGALAHSRAHQRLGAHIFGAADYLDAPGQLRAPSPLGAHNFGALAHSRAQQQLGAHNFGAPAQFKAPSEAHQRLGAHIFGAMDAPAPQFRAPAPKSHRAHPYQRPAQPNAHQDLAPNQYDENWDPYAAQLTPPSPTALFLDLEHVAPKFQLSSEHKLDPEEYERLQQWLENDDLADEEPDAPNNDENAPESPKYPEELTLVNKYLWPSRSEEHEEHPEELEEDQEDPEEPDECEEHKELNPFDQILARLYPELAHRLYE